MFRIVVLTSDEDLRLALTEIISTNVEHCDLSVMKAQDIYSGSSGLSNTDLLVLDCAEVINTNFHVFDLIAVIDPLKVIFVRDLDTQIPAAVTWMFDHFEIDKPLNIDLVKYFLRESIDDCELNRSRFDFVQSLAGKPASKKAETRQACADG